MLQLLQSVRQRRAEEQSLSLSRYNGQDRLQVFAKVCAALFQQSIGLVHDLPNKATGNDKN